MTDQQIKDEFVTVYNRCADDIFTYCYSRIANRDIAKYLTRNIFMRTWDLVSTAGESILTVEKTLYRTAKDHIDSFIQSKRREINFTENLWNLTLSQ